MSIIRQEHLMPSHDAIARRAYELYEQRGRENGHDWDDWLQAERELAGADASTAGVPNQVTSAPRRRRPDREQQTTAVV